MKRAVYVMLALAAVLLLALPFTRQAVYVSAAQLQERLSAAAEQTIWNKRMRHSCARCCRSAL